jgi:hypothetical protein
MKKQYKDETLQDVFLRTGKESFNKKELKQVLKFALNEMREWQYFIAQVSIRIKKLK